MSERNNDELAKLRNSLANNQRQQEQRNVESENIRLQLERIARESTAKYQREIEATRHEAQTAITQVIQPWFSDLITSGAYADLQRWCNSQERDVRLSETIIYYWPEDALNVLAKGSSKPYSSTAQFVSTNYRGKSLPSGIEKHADGDEAWYAGFELESGNWGKSNGIKIWRQPVAGMGYGFAMIRKSYELAVDPHSVISSLDTISPEVWVKFGQQIENGAVWKTIERSMLPRRVTAAAPIQGNKYRAEQRLIAEEYLRTRQWH